MLILASIFHSNKALTFVSAKTDSKKKNIRPEGFIISNDKIYLSLNNGRLIIIETLTGKPIDIIKIDNQKISRPYIVNNEMFIVRDNAIIKLN